MNSDINEFIYVLMISDFNELFVEVMRYQTRDTEPACQLQLLVDGCGYGG